MAYNDPVELEAGVWTRLTQNNTSAATIRNPGFHSVLIAGTVGANAPGLTEDDFLKAIELPSRAHMFGSDTFADIWRGLEGVDNLYGFCPVATKLFVSHGD
jgi:hypothetical protein